MITFAYPDLSMPTALAVIGDAEILPYARPVRFRQTVFLTDAGGEAVYDFGGQSQVFTMQLAGLSKAERDMLSAFFTNPSPNGVNGRALPFSLRDSLGDIYTVRLAQDTFEFTMSSPALYDINLTLRVAG